MVKRTFIKPGRWLTIAQAAEHAGVSEKTIDRWLSSGDLLPARIGRVVRIDIVELDNFLRGGRR